MARSFLTSVFAAAFSLSMIGCSSKAAQSPKPVLPEVTVRTATMNITGGIEVLARVALPDGFAPSPDYPPMWLQNGQEVAVVGTRERHAVIMGYSGTGFGTARVLAKDGSLAAPDDGRIVDVAASPDGMVLALAVAHPRDNRVDVVTRDVISEAGAHSVSSFDGEFDSASVGWLDSFTIPLALRAQAAAIRASSSAPDAEKTPASAPAASGLYTIGINGAVTAGYTKLNCTMSRLKWSPDGNFAVGEGDAIAPPMIVSLEKESCQRLNARAPIRVLDWSPDGKSFLFQETNLANETVTYRFDIATNTSRLVAIASGAAVFVDNGDVLALGNDDLTFAKILNAPDARCHAKIARSNPAGSEIDIEALGFDTTPAMLAASRMVYARETAAAAITAYSPTPQGPVRKIVIYSVSRQNAYLVAFGLLRGAASLSWSPHGHYLAIADGDAFASALTVIAPPE